jgi:ubiquitin-conjugating enzyme E2 variant
VADEATFSPAASLAAVVLGMLAADLLSGVVHWAFDTWGSPATPWVGALAIRTFREHHANARAMLDHDFVETNGHNIALSATASALGLCALGPFAERALFATACFVAMTSQIHKWAHMDEAPPLVRLLQRVRLVLSPGHHRGHHDAPHTRNYCITTGWLNAPLAALRLWERLEAVIEKVTSARPRSG